MRSCSLKLSLVGTNQSHLKGTKGLHLKENHSQEGIAMFVDEQGLQPPLVEFLRT